MRMRMSRLAVGLCLLAAGCGGGYAPNYYQPPPPYHSRPYYHEYDAGYGRVPPSFYPYGPVLPYSFDPWPYVGDK